MLTCLVTHNDLDGLGCDTAVRQVYDNVSSWRVNYDKAHDAIMEAIAKGPDVLIIADVWTADRNSATKALVDFPGRLMIFDHHKSTEAAQKHISLKRNECGYFYAPDVLIPPPYYDGSLVVHGEGTSSTGYANWFLRANMPAAPDVNQYDTTGDVDCFGGQINQLFYEMDVEEVRAILLRESRQFTDAEEEILDGVYEAIDAHYEAQKHTLRTYEIGDYKVAVMECTEGKSVIYNRLLFSHDYVTIIDRKKHSASFRGQYEGCDELAAKFGGGGHPMAAGAQTEATYEEIVEAYKEVLNEV